MTRRPVSEADLARRATRAEFVTRLFVLVLLTLLVAAVVTILQIRQTQVTNTKKTDNTVATLAAVKDLSKQINSCVKPGKPCYQDAQKRTAGVLSDLSRIITLAAACAVDVTPAQTIAEREASITDCISQRLTTPPGGS